jgi:hypothetical protein
MKIELGEAQNLLMKRVRKVCHAFCAQDVASTMWALAKMSVELGYAQKPLIRTITRVGITGMAPERSTDMMWGLVKMNIQLGEIHEELRLSASTVCSSMNAARVANTLWALAKMNV